MPAHRPAHGRAKHGTEQHGCPPYGRIDDATDRGATRRTEHREPPPRLPEEPPRFLGKQIAFHHTTDERCRCILTLDLIMVINPLHLIPTCPLKVP